MKDNSDDLTTRLRQSLNARGPAPELSADLVTHAAARTAPSLVDHRRRLQAAGVGALAIAAVTVGALVITMPSQREPLFIAAGSSSTSALGSEEGMSSDLRIGPWVDYRYEAGGGLSTEAGTGSVYQLKRVGEPQEVIRDVAHEFGLDGEPTKSDSFDPAYPTYLIGLGDGTAASLVVTWTGTGNWWYSNPAANPAVVCEPAAPDGTELCSVPEPAAGSSLAPSEAEARLQAQALFAATGLDVSADRIRITADDWQTMATASLTVDGIETAIEWAVAWSTTGEIAWAYGHSIEVVDKGSFGTISAADAVDRLADWRWFGAAGPAYQVGLSSLAADAGRAAEEEDPVVTDPDAPVKSPEETPVPSETPAPTDEPQPAPGEEPVPEPTLEPEPAPTPEVVVVTVNEAEKTLLLMWDSEGNAWLVPGYAMPHPDGWWNTIVSLEEGVIELPEPVEFEPLGVDDTGVVK